MSYRYTLSSVCAVAILAFSIAIRLMKEEHLSVVTAAQQAALEPISADERSAFYHLPEGSEVFPLQWLKQLQSVQTHLPFLEDMSRFGLIIDPDNSLPIGLSASPTRDVHFGTSPMMVGVTCAACHTGEFTYKGKRVVVEGAPAQFDLHAYYQDLFTSTKSLATDLDSFIRFYWRVSGEPQHEAFSVANPQTAITWSQAMTLPSSRRLADSIDSKTALQSDNQFDQKAITVLKQQLEQDRQAFDRDPQIVRAHPTILSPTDTQNILSRYSTSSLSLSDEKKISSLRLKDSGLSSSKSLDRLRTQVETAGDTSALIRIAPNDAERSVRLGLAFDDIRTQFRLLLARVLFLKTLSSLPAQQTAAGFGRLDAFGNARDILWPDSPVPITAPVSYPALWEFSHKEYVHWDADTTSVIERNIGQALGLGAVLDKKTFISTVNPRNLHSLEVIAAKLVPPKWPEDVFGQINSQKASAGKQLYEANCAGCHKSVEGSQRLFATNEIGTDPMRANNFALPVGNVGFDVSIELMMDRIKAQAYKDNLVTADEATAFDGKQPPPGQPKWRVTRKYAAGSLSGIWATSPYLHNGSILNLHELLLTAAQRKKTFYQGCVEYDPLNVGFIDDPACREFPTQFDSSAVGNSNAGHEYGTTLSEDQKWALIEYLKTL